MSNTNKKPPTLKEVFVDVFVVSAAVLIGLLMLAIAVAFIVVPSWFIMGFPMPFRLLHFVWLFFSISVVIWASGKIDYVGKRVLNG